MRHTLVAVLLAAVVTLAGCGAIDVTPVADPDGNTDAGADARNTPSDGTSGGAGAPSTDPPAEDVNAADAPGRSLGPETMRLRNHRSDASLVTVYFVDSPAERFTLTRGDGSTETVEVPTAAYLEDVVTADVVGVAPAAGTVASERYVVESASAGTVDLPASRGDATLVYVVSGAGPDGTVESAGRLACSDGTLGTIVLELTDGGMGASGTCA